MRLVPVEITPSEPTTVAVKWRGGLRLPVPIERLHKVLDVLESRRC